MVALELFTVSGLYAAYRIIQYMTEKESLDVSLAPLSDGAKLEESTPSSVEKFVELSAAVTKNEHPTYIGIGSGMGVGIPIGGGTTYEMRSILTAAIQKGSGPDLNWTFTDLEKHPCGPSNRYWLNTPDDLKTFFDANGISQTSVPLSLPLEVREVKVPASVKTLYRVPQRYVMGTNRHAVIQAAAARYSIKHPLFRPALALATGTGVYLLATWDSYESTAQRRSMREKMGI